MALPRQEFFGSALSGWTMQGGADIIATGGQGAGNGATDCHAFDGNNSYANDQYSKLTYVSGSSAGPGLRASVVGALKNMVFLLGSSGGSTMYHVLAGSYGSLGSATALSNGQLVRGKIVSFDVTFYADGTQIGTVNDTSAPAIGSSGIYINGTSARVDNWEGGNGAGDDTVPSPGAGRTTKNTRPNPLGLALGIERGISQPTLGPHA